MALPTLLLTRPTASSEAFVATLDPAARGAVEVLIAPLMEIVATGRIFEMGESEIAIFTSANGVRFAPMGRGRLAFCVGAQTTKHAINRGWNAKQAGDNAHELIATLCKKRPMQRLKHLGGEHTIGDIAETLSAQGMPTTHETLYEQRLLPLDHRALAALGSPCIVPVFSSRSAAQLLKEAKNRLSQTHIIALSESVAAPFEGENIGQCIILSAPQSIYMRKAVENLCLTLSVP